MPGRILSRIRFPVPNLAYKIVRVGVISTALLLVLMAAAAVRLTYEFLDANAWVRHTTAVISEVRSTRMLLGMAAGAGSSRSAAEPRIAALREQLDRVERLTHDNSWQQRNISDFRQQIASPPAAAPRSGSVFSPSALQGANDVLDRMQREEYGLLLQRSTVEAGAMQNAGIAVLALCAGLIALGIVTTVTARKEYHRRVRAEAILQHEKQELKRYTEELALVSAGSEVTQAAQNESQLCQAVAKVLRDLLPGSFGYFGLINGSRDSIDIVESWETKRTLSGALPAHHALLCSSAAASLKARMRFTPPARTFDSGLAILCASRSAAPMAIWASCTSKPKGEFRGAARIP